MSKKKLIALIIIIVIILGILVKVLLSGPIFANQYTKVALKKNFSQAFMAHTAPDSSDTPLGIACGASGIAGNILVYVYYAGEDYQAGHISEAQFMQVIANSKPAIVWINGIFEKNYQISLQYPIKQMDIGPCYYELINGNNLYNTVNFVKLQPIIFALINQMYQSQDPNQIIQDVKQYSVYMEQGTFYYQYNTQYGLDEINANGFKPE